ncbi:MAG: dicarboxylate/amino acid:cation symporter, partial [Gammaproteobacteria bacterium]|nr:dicarboxylate/amino acid:cation symporter [Gammaproteobacteria bacterium]
GEATWMLDLMRALKTLFLSALKMIMAPLIFFSLIAGILKMGSANRLGRTGGLAVGYYLTTTSIAISIGLICVFFIQPWTLFEPLSDTSQFDIDFDRIESLDGSGLAVLSQILKETLVSPFTALANLNILAIAINAVLIGLALLLVAGNNAAVVNVVDTITNIFYKITSWVIWVVPLGVLGIVYELTVSAELELIKQLVVFSILVVVATCIHGFVVIPSIAYFVGKADLRELFKHGARPLIVAFTTSSSAATIPVTLTAAQNLKISDSTRTFIIPFGATANMDGSALFEGIAAVFIAYLFGVELTATIVVLIFFASMLASIGAPGIPSGSMAGMQAVLLMVGLPLEGVLILLIVERPLDMIRTSINVFGDLVGSLVVDRFSQSEEPMIEPQDSEAVAS